MGGEVTREEVIGDINRMSRNKIKIKELKEIFDITMFTPDEISFLYKKFLQLKPNKDSVITYQQFMQCDFMRNSPFGFHLLEVFRLVDVKETYENNFIESLFQVVNEVISFRMFVLIMFCFSEHIDNEQKSVIYFKLFDFDNDEKISKNDIETYLCNLSKSPEELIDIPLREYNNDTVDTNKDNNISQMELPNTIKEQKQERQQSDADLLTLVENKRIKEDEQKDTVINVNNNTNDNIKEEERALYRKIAEMIINESSNKDYLSYTDFKYMFIGSQYLKDYTHNIYLYD